MTTKFQHLTWQTAIVGLLLNYFSAGTSAAQGAWEVATYKDLEVVARNVLTRAQPLSFRKNREYCGYIGFDGEGYLRASRPKRGRRDSCTPDAPNNWELVASYHTHAAYDPEAASEWPSSDDVWSDSEEGVDGFVATPGGRLWFIDGEALIVNQVCGIGCLPQDPNFEREPHPPAARYAIHQLEALE